MFTIFIGSDHAGFTCKKALYNHLRKRADVDVIEDVGSYSESPIDYPDIAKELCKSMKQQFTTGKTHTFGVLICGTGEGMCMAANKYEGCRAGIAWKPEIAMAIREHNNANVICLPARHLTTEEAIEIIDVFLNTSFSSEERHLNRIRKIE